MKKDTGKLLFGLLVGGLLGAGVSFMAMSDNGEDFRARVGAQAKNKLQEVRRDAVEVTDEMIKRAGNTLESSKEAIVRGTQKIEEMEDKLEKAEQKLVQVQEKLDEHSDFEE